MVVWGGPTNIWEKERSERQRRKGKTYPTECRVPKIWKESLPQWSVQRNSQSAFGIDHLVMPMCRAVSCVVGRGCLLWPVCSLGKILLAFPLLHLVLQGQTFLLLQVSLDFLLLHFSPLWWKEHLFWVLVLEDLVGLHRTVELQLLQHEWLGYRLGLLWYWMICLGNEQRPFCCFWGWTQVLHFGLFCWPWWLLHFFWGILAHSSRYNGHLN